MSMSIRRSASVPTVLALSLVMLLAAGVSAAPGELDPSFSGDGMKTVDFSGRYEEADAVLIQPNGRILLAGGVHLGQDDDIGLTRLNRGGHLDKTFGRGGIAVSDPGGDESAVDAALMDDGRIVVAVSPQDRPGFIVGRYDPNGSPDTTFGGDGSVELTPGSGSGSRAVAVQDDGKVVEAGLVRLRDQNDADFGIVRLKASGGRDRTFGDNGVALVDFGVGGAGAEDVEILPNGDILAVGTARLGGEQRFAFAELDEDGVLDPAFSGDGRLTIDFGAGHDEAAGVAVQDDGRIVAAGCADCFASSHVALARVLPNGSLDSSFNGDGLRTLTLDTLGVERASDVVVQEDERIAVAGCAVCQLDPANNFVLARFEPNGARDLTFGDRGVVQTTFGRGSDAARALAVQDDGSLVAAGYTGDVVHRRFAVARYQGS